MCEFLEQHGAVERADAVVVLVAQGRVVVVVLVLDLHEGDRLLELFERILQHGRVLEALDKLGEELHVLGDGADAVGVDGLDLGEEGEGLLGQEGGVSRWHLAVFFFFLLFLFSFLLWAGARRIGRWWGEEGSGTWRLTRILSAA